jgi:hypothetical protein
MVSSAAGQGWVRKMTPVAAGYNYACGCCCVCMAQLASGPTMRHVLLLQLLASALVLSVPAWCAIALLLGQAPAGSRHKQEPDEKAVLHMEQQLLLATRLLT